MENWDVGIWVESMELRNGGLGIWNRGNRIVEWEIRNEEWGRSSWLVSDDPLLP